MAKSEFTCPFCFESISLERLHYRCYNKWCSAYRQEADDEYSKYVHLRIPLRLGHVINNARTTRTLRGTLKPVACDVCGSPAVPICPKCHNTLPDSSYLGTDNIISVIGTRSAGKSVYITVLINELMKRVAPALGASMTGFVDMSGLYDANDVYDKTKYDKLYGEGKLLDQTQKSSGQFNQTSDMDKRPLIYRFAYVQGRVGRKDDFTLSFLDSAGEDQQNASDAATVMRYIANSKGIIFLLDPLQIPEVLEQVEGRLGRTSTSTGTAGHDANAAPEVVLANMTTLIRQSLGLAGKRKKIDIPVAIAFSKLDAIQPILPSGMAMQRLSPHCGARAFVEHDAQQVDAEMRSLLQSWGEQALINQIALDYKDYAFFALSSLGFDNEPRNDLSIKRPTPHRVEDPLLWLMAQNRLLGKTS